MAGVENIMRHPVIRLLFLVMLIWSLFSLLNRFFGTTILLFLMLLFVLAAVVAWMLRHQRAELAKVYKYPVAKQFINLVCKATSSQPPVEGKNKKDQSDDELLLKSSSEFRRAEEELLKIVRGHDLAITQILSRLRDNLVLRSRMQLPLGAPPVAAFLLLGESGIGKRHAAREIARRLYKQRSLLTLSMADYSNDVQGAEALFGNSSNAGVLLSQVRAKPYHTIILEDVELASPKVLDQLSKLLTTGTAVDPSNHSPISFQHCVFFITTSQEIEKLRVVQRNIETHLDWMQKSFEILSAHGQLQAKLLSYLSEIILFQRPDAVSRAEVLLLLAEQECQKYGVSLQYIDAEVLASEVNSISSDTGFELAPARVERLLKRVLVRAAKTNTPRVSLRSQDCLAQIST